jgi:PAS domain S-box-containing protein
MISYVQNMVKLFQHSRQFYYITTDPQGNYAYTNHYFRERFSHLADDFIGVSFLATLCPDDIEKYQDAVSLCMAEPGKPVTVELRQPGARANYLWTMWEISTLPSTDGLIKGIQYIGVDISKKKEQLESLELSERKYQFIFDEEPLPTWIYDLETLRFLEVNKAAINLYGFSEEEFKRMSILDIRPEECRAEMVQLLKSVDAVHTRLHKHLRHMKKNGEEIQVDVHSFGLIFEGRRARFVTAIDVTDKMKQRAALEDVTTKLKNTNDELNSILENISEAIFKLDPESNLIYTSPEFTRLTGYEAAAVMGKRWFDFIHPEDLDTCYDAFGRVFEGKEVMHNIRYRFRHANGNYRWFSTSATFVLNAEKQLLYGIGISQDVTERKYAEEALEASEERYKAFITQSSEAIWRYELEQPIQISEPVGKIIHHLRNRGFVAECNDIMARMHGYENSAQLIGARMDELVNPSEKKNMDYLVAFIRNNFKLSDAETIEVDEYGITRYFLNNIIGIVENGYLKRAWGTRREISERRRAEETLRFQANILENVSDIIVSTDLNHCITSWNKAAQEIYGIPAQEAIGKHFTSVVKFDYLQASDKEVELSYRNNGIWKGEVSFLDRKGQTKFLLITASSVYDEKAFQTGFIIVARDISDRKFAEEQLKGSELFYKNLIGDSLDGILLTDESGRIKFVAYSISKILGFEVEELIGKNIFEFLHPDDVPMCQEAFAQELVNQPKVKFIVIRLPKKEGGWTWCMVRGHNLLNNPYVQSMVIYFHDDTLRKQAEDELKKTALQLRTAQHIAGLAYMEIDGATGSLFYSDEMFKVFGIASQQMPSDLKGLLTLVHPADRTKIKSDIEYAIENGGTIQHEFRVSLPGMEKIIQAIGYLDKEHEGAATLKITVQDVTTIRSAQLALLNSESKFRSLFESSIDGIILTQVGGSVRSANPAICEMLGYTQDEIIEKKRWDIFDFVDPDSPDQRSHEDGSFKGELFLLHKRGHRIPCEVSSVLFTDSQGRSYHSTIVRDITKQKEAEEELKKREMILSATNQKLEVAVSDLNKIMDYSMDVICSMNERGEFVQVSAASEKVWGYKPAEVIGKKFTDFVINVTADDALNDLVSGGESVSSNFENQFRCKDGTPVFLEWSAYWYEKERIAFCVARDITLQKEIEKQLVASETRFRAFMNNSPAFSWIADEDGKLMYLNKASIQVLPVTPQDIGRKIFDLFPPTVAASFHQNNLSVLMMNKPAEAIETVPFKNGTIGTILAYLFPINFEENAGKRLVGCVAIDISAKTKAEEALRNSERNLNAIFSSTKDAFFLLDKSLKVVAFNREAEEWYRRYAKGRSVQESPDPIRFLPEERQALVRLNMEKVLRGAGIEYEVEYVVEHDHAWFNAVMQPVVGSGGEIDGVVVSISNITSKKLADKQITETAEQLTNIMETISDGMFILNDDLTVKYMNRSAEELLHVDRSSFVGKHKNEVLSLLGANGESPETTFIYIDKAIQKRKAISFTEYHGRLHCWFEGVIYPIGGGVTIYFRDVTERKRQDMILRLEKEVLEINAIPESTLENTAQHFLKGLERIQPNTRFSVQLLSEDKRHMKPLAAPSMSKEFIKGISALAIGPNKGSCGTAMFSKKPVYVSDTAKDPLWKDYQNVAIKNNFRASWSIPIINAQNDVLGSFAIYFYQPKEPSAVEVNMVERAANILRVIIENKSAEEQIRMSNQRYHFVTKATNEAIWDLDLVTNNIYWAEGYHTLFGYDPSKVYGSFAESQERVHPSDLERINKSLKSFLRKKTRTKWEDEYRYRKADGSYAHVLDKAYLIHDNKGNPIRLIGSMQDITSRRELEQKLLEQEIGKQRLLTQATIDGQEKERKEIGKELHDNINQILSTTKLYLDLAQNTSNGQTAEMIGMGSKNIMEAINEIRKLSRSLVPPTLGDLGLIESVRDLCENFNNTRTFKVKFEHRNIREKQLADNQKLMLFRIIQEQTNNIVKHAKAKNVIISLRASKGSINLEITDDGQGFNLKKTKKSVGLTNIINRAELFNGKVDIITAPKKGCTIKVSIPLATKI